MAGLVGGDESGESVGVATADRWAAGDAADGVPGAHARHGRGEDHDERRDRQRERPAAHRPAARRRGPGRPGCLRRRRGRPLPQAGDRLPQRGAVGPFGPPVRADHRPPGVPEGQYQRVRIRHGARDGERPEPRTLLLLEFLPSALQVLGADGRDDDQGLVPVAAGRDGLQFPPQPIGDLTGRCHQDDEAGPRHQAGHDGLPVGRIDGLPRRAQWRQPGLGRVDGDHRAVPREVPGQHLFEGVEPAQGEPLDERGPAERGRPQLEPVVAERPQVQHRRPGIAEHQPACLDRSQPAGRAEDDRAQHDQDEPGRLQVASHALGVRRGLPGQDLHRGPRRQHLVEAEEDQAGQPEKNQRRGHGQQSGDEDPVRSGHQRAVLVAMDPGGMDEPASRPDHGQPEDDEHVPGPIADHERIDAVDRDDQAGQLRREPADGQPPALFRPAGDVGDVRTSRASQAWPGWTGAGVGAAADCAGRRSRPRWPGNRRGRRRTRRPRLGPGRCPKARCPGYRPGPCATGRWRACSSGCWPTPPPGPGRRRAAGRSRVRGPAARRARHTGRR